MTWTVTANTVRRMKCQILVLVLVFVFVFVFVLVFDLVSIFAAGHLLVGHI